MWTKIKSFFKRVADKIKNFFAPANELATVAKQFSELMEVIRKLEDQCEELEVPG